MPGHTASPDVEARLLALPFCYFTFVFHVSCHFGVCNGCKHFVIICIVFILFFCCQHYETENTRGVLEGGIIWPSTTEGLLAAKNMMAGTA